MNAQPFRRTPLLLLALVVAGICAAGVSVRASGASTPASSASQLAARVTNAHTPASRYQALLAVMKALDVPVFTAGGKALTPGARGLPKSLNLYDFELRALADALGRGSAISVDGLARVFAHAGARISSSALAKRLASGVRAAAARPASGSLLALLVRDLGLKHRPAVDLATAAKPTTSLDQLQALLIAVDSAARTHGARYLAASQADPCTGPVGAGNGVGQGPAVGPPVGSSVVSSLLEVWIYKATVVNTPNRETHYGPAGHTVLAGNTLRLGVRIEVKDWVPNIVRCGLEADHAPLPKSGLLAGEQVDWAYAELAKYGIVTFDPAGGVTGLDGVSTLVFKPRTEIVPDFGTVYTRTGQVTASGLSEGGLPVFYNASQDWKVSYHKPRGFKFTMQPITFTNKAPDGTITVLPVSISGRVCGEDPYTVPWTITESIKNIQASYPVTLPELLPVTTDANGDFPHEWKLVDQGNGDLEASVKITPGAPFSGTFTPATASSQARVVEDKSCPDNSDEG